MMFWDSCTDPESQRLAPFRPIVGWWCRHYATQCPWLDGEDLENEAWVACWRALEGFDATLGVHPNAWVSKRVRSHLSHVIRTMHRFDAEVAYLSEEHDEDGWAFRPGREGGAWGNTWVRPCDLRDVVTALPPLQKETVVLHYWRDLSYEEIGRVVHVSKGAIEYRHGEALSSLRVALEVPAPPAAQPAPVTPPAQCAHGHALDGKNLYVNARRGLWQCKRCRAESARRRRTSPQKGYASRTPVKVP